VGREENKGLKLEESTTNGHIERDKNPREMSNEDNEGKNQRGPTHKKLNTHIR